MDSLRFMNANPAVVEETATLPGPCSVGSASAASARTFTEEPSRTPVGESAPTWNQGVSK